MSRRRRRNKPTADSAFWGAPADEVTTPDPIRPTSDPGALLRSLGDPPLGPNRLASSQHLTAVYEEAVRAATALAAANGLLRVDND